MAGDWIKMRVCLWTHPKVVTLSSQLSVTRAHAIGALHCAWSIADQHADDSGNVTMTTAALDSLSETPGLADAMQAVGWLKVNGSTMQFIEYQQHNGTTGKQRADAQKRQRASRSRHSSVTTPSQKTVTREEREKRREEKKKPPKPPLRTTEEQTTTRPRDELFDAIVQATGADPKLNGSHVGKTAAALRSAEPPYSPEEVREFGQRFWTWCSWAKDDKRPRPTLGEVEKYIGQVRAQRVSGTATPEIVAQMLERRKADEQAAAQRVSAEEFRKLRDQIAGEASNGEP